MSTIIINDQWYDVGFVEEVKAGGLYLSNVPWNNRKGKDTFFTASAAEENNQILRHPLTPIPAPIWAKLGMEVLAFVPEDRQGDIINFGMEPDGCEMAERIVHDGVRAAQKNVMSSPVVWLSPPPAPKKTTEELLTDIVTIHDNMATVFDIEKMAAAIKAAKQHLQQNEQALP